MWINVDVAEPSYDTQIVKVKVVDFSNDYITDAHYNHIEQKWYSKNGICLNDNVYHWKIPLLKIFKENLICVLHVIIKNLKMKMGG